MKLFHEIETHNCRTPNNKSAVTMSLYQLQELASRQQEQIESTHRLIMNKEQRLNYLSSVQDSQHGPMFDYDQNFGHLKEKIALQESKLRKLRLLKGQAKKQLSSNSNICSELETTKIIYKEKERELSVAITKIEALTRQLDEIKKGIISNSYNMSGTFKHTTELEKLRQELLYKTKMCKQNEEELIIKRNMLFKRQAEIVKIDQKISELQSRLTRKRQLNQQLSSQMHSIRSTNTHSSINNDALFAPKTYLRSSIGHSGQMNKVPYDRNVIASNVATVEPLPRYKGSILKYEFVPQLDFSANKQDSKYQTLPYNTKFGARNGHMNYANTKKVDSSNLNGYFQSMSNNNCDNVTDNVSGNNISLIINHKNDSKDTSLEERPSPSGSSGSSDRISSSLTTYSYNDKMSLSNMTSNNQNYYNNLDKNYLREQSVKETDLYSHQYVPNSSLPDNRNETNQPNSCSVLDNYYKTKPSAPIKPVSNEPSADVVDNSCLKSSFLLNQRNVYDNYSDKEKLYSIENYEKSQQLHASLMSSLNRSQIKNQEQQTPESECPEDSASNLSHSHDSKFNSIENYDDKENRDKNCDNMKNYEIEQRTSVSEIITKLNSWNIPKNPFDWEKAKRRPVLMTNEMEQELRDSNANKSDLDIADANKTKVTSSNLETVAKQNSNDDNNNKLDQDLANNNSRTTKNDDNNYSNETNNETNKKGETKISSPLKRLKGNLKSQECTKTKIPLRRRVSFDPLALLLDASLEGELELVKKTSSEVPNPSASNDEGITALHNATCAAHFDIVKYLIEIGCDVNVQDSDGWTPLHCAASCNNLVMIKFLVKSGACIFATTFSDHETAAEKCEEDEEGFDGCSQYLYGIQDKLGFLNNGTVYAVYDYESQNSDELSFKDGDVIQILRKGDEQEKEWWWSRIADKEGYIPRNLIGLYPRIKPSYK